MATPKKPTPKVKITGSASGRAATGTKSVIRGASMAQSPKIVDRKPVAKKAKTTVYKPKQTSPGQQVAKAAGKVIGRAKSVAREVRDIPTAVAGAGKAFGKASQKGNVGGAAGKARGSVTNIGKQIVEIGKTAVTGKKGTTATGKKRK
jgi:hypothetical protein